jgi:predicted O-methyltransferase YrrM
MRPIEHVKYWTYRLPFGRAMAPRYPYKIDPGQLGALLAFIDATRDAGGAVVEIGVAQGQTSAFLLEHLRTTGDDRKLLLFDTFSGFTEESVRVEIDERGKGAHKDLYQAFRYGDEQIFRSKLQRAGYRNFETFKGDASTFDWSSIGPIGCVLIDIDLYAPTARILDVIYPYLCEGGGIVVDDCVPDTPWDGSLQAYAEFVQVHGLPFERVGGNGAVIRR